MPFEPEIAYKIGVILIFSLFLCLAAWSYLHHQFKGQKRVRVDYIRDKLGMTANRDLLAMGWAEGPHGQDYWVPIGSAVLVTIFGLASCLFANELLSVQTFFNDDSGLPIQHWHSILLVGLYQAVAYPFSSAGSTFGMTHDHA